MSALVFLAAVLFGAVWSITEKECLPGGNLFGITILFICALIGGKVVALIHLPKLPPFPPLLGKAEYLVVMCYARVCLYKPFFNLVNTDASTSVMCNTIHHLSGSVLRLLNACHIQYLFRTMTQGAHCSHAGSPMESLFNTIVLQLEQIDYRVLCMYSTNNCINTSIRASCF